MANLSEICEELFWIFFEEELCNFGVLQAARSAGWWHPAGQSADRLSGFKVLLQPLAHLYEWSLFSMDYCKKKIAILHCLCSAQRARNKPQQSSFHFLQSRQPWCWDNVTAPLWHQSSTSSRTETKSKTQNEAHSMLQHLLDPLHSSQKSLTSSSPASPHYWDTLPLKSYTHCVLKNGLDFVMSVTKCLFFRGLLAIHFFRETASRTGDTRLHTRCSSFCSASAEANTHWNCDWHMRQWTIGHWQTLSSEELAISDTTGNV